MGHLNKYFSQIVTFCLALIMMFPAYSARLSSNNLHDIDESLKQYSEQFPQIHFLRLYGSQGLERALLLKQELGRRAYDMTYEHDYDVSELLIDAQINRIAMMIENNMPSATLFHTGENSNFQKQYVCVISLDKELFAGDPQSATRILVGNINIDVQRIQKKSVVNNIVFANFTLHHEVSHCLEAYLDGPTIHKTITEIENSYELFRSEQRADFFAALVYRSMNNEESGFLQQLVNYRTLSLLDWDVSHFTAPTLKKAIVLRNDLFYGNDLYDLAEISLRLSDSYVLSPDMFNAYMITAYHTAVKYNVYDAVLAPEAVELKDKKVDAVSMMLLEKSLAEARHAILH